MVCKDRPGGKFIRSFLSTETPVTAARQDGTVSFAYGSSMEKTSGITLARSRAPSEGSAQSRDTIHPWVSEIDDSTRATYVSEIPRPFAAVIACAAWSGLPPWNPADFRAAGSAGTACGCW